MYHCRETKRKNVLATRPTPVRQTDAPIADMESIASRLKAARFARGWRQEDLAAAAGVSLGTVGNIEAGIRTGLQSLAALAECLGVRYRWLRLGEEPMKDDSWPFEAISPRRIARLSPVQRARIEGYLLAKIEAFEQDADDPKGAGQLGS